MNTRLIIISSMVGFLWCIASIVEKYNVVSNYTISEILTLKSFGILLCIGIYSIVQNNTFPNIRKIPIRINIKNSGILTIGVLGTVLFWMGLREYDASTIMPMAVSAQLISAAVISFVIISEKRNITNLIGILLAVFAVWLISDD